MGGMAKLLHPCVVYGLYLAGCLVLAATAVSYLFLAASVPFFTLA
jgi:hypothetical protein